MLLSQQEGLLTTAKNRLPRGKNFHKLLNFFKALPVRDPSFKLSWRHRFFLKWALFTGTPHRVKSVVFFLGKPASVRIQLWVMIVDNVPTFFIRIARMSEVKGFELKYEASQVTISLQKFGNSFHEFVSPKGISENTPAVFLQYFLSGGSKKIIPVTELQDFIQSFP